MEAVRQTFPASGGREGVRYVHALQHRWPLLVLLVALAVAAAITYSQTAAKQYEAEADVLVTPFEDPSEAFAGISLFRDASSSVYAAGRIVTTPKVTEAVIKRLNLDLDRRGLLDSVRVEPLQQSNIVAITVKSGSPTQAARIANGFAEVMIDQRTAAFQAQLKAAIQRVSGRLAVTTAKTSERTALEEQLATLRSLVGAPDPTVESFSPAVPPDKPIWPRPLLSALIAFLAALILGVIAVLVLEALDPRIVDEDELGEELPVVAWVPRARRSVVRKYLQGKGALPGDMWEAYRTLRAGILGEPTGNSRARTILVTSAVQGEGKTMTSVNLAIALAAAGGRVIIIDGDLRRPMVASVFGVNAQSDGLTSVLLERATPEEALTSAPGYGDRLRLIPAGSGRPVDLLEPRRIQRVLHELEAEADFIILDSPPLTEFADAFALAEAVDVVLIAVRVGWTRRDRFIELRRFLAQHGIFAAGFVVTRRRRSRGYGSAPTPEKEPEVPVSKATFTVASLQTAGRRKR
jgi:capsular exopolysaccharide synthesis family protein